ncbi:MAG: flagellar hook-length control protein FliK [Planctomycetota bacterium]
MTSVQALQASVGAPRPVEPVSRSRSSNDGETSFGQALASVSGEVESETSAPTAVIEEPGTDAGEPERDGVESAVDSEADATDSTSASTEPADTQGVDLENSEVVDPATVFVAPQRPTSATTNVESTEPVPADPDASEKPRVESRREPAPVPTPRPEGDPGGVDRVGVGVQIDSEASARAEVADVPEPRRTSAGESRGEQSEAPEQVTNTKFAATSGGGEESPARDRRDESRAQELPKPDRTAQPERVETARVSASSVEQASTSAPPAAASSGSAPTIEVTVQAPSLETPAARTGSSSLASALQAHRGSDQQAASPVVDHAARGIAAVLAQKGGSLTMKLNPPALGELRIEMNLSKQSVEVRLEAGTAAARDLLSLGLPALRESLQSKGLSVERLSVQASAHAAPSAPGANASGNSLADQGGTNAERSDGRAQERTHDGSDDRPRDGSGGAAGNGRGHAERAEASSRSFGMRLDALI